MILDAHLWAGTIERWRGTYRLAQQDLLEPFSWRRQVRDDASFLLANPFGRAWWERIKIVVEDLPEELVEYVDEVLAGAADNQVGVAYSDIMKRMESANQEN